MVADIVLIRSPLTPKGGTKTENRFLKYTL